MDLPTSLLPVVRLLSALPNRVGFLSRVYPGFFKGNMLPPPFIPGAGV
jgi:hypothetical protein